MEEDSRGKEGRRGKNSLWKALSHEVVIAKVIVSVGVGVLRDWSPTNGQCRLGLGRLGLLAALLRLLFLELLVAQRGQRTGNLLDLVARQLASELLGKLDHEERIVGLFGVVGNDGANHLTQRLELGFCLGVKQRHGGQIDQVLRVAGVGDGGALDDGLARRGHRAYVAAKEVLGVGEVGGLLLAQEPCALGGLVFFFRVVAIFL